MLKTTEILSPNIKKSYFLKPQNVKFGVYTDSISIFYLSFSEYFNRDV